LNPPKVVFDTNILISAYFFGGQPRVTLDIARGGKSKEIPKLAKVKKVLSPRLLLLRLFYLIRQPLCPQNPTNPPFFA